jgi:eukaryotic-like serine/threonine-protein kinase
MSEPTSDRDQRVNEAIAWYYQQVEGGSPPGPEPFLNRFPDVRTELQSFLADKAAFDRAAGPADPDATVTGGPAPAIQPEPLGRVRYFGDYELLDEIARGGMGVVYKARQVSLNRTVALKMILSGQLASATDVQRFRAEAEAAANLDHPNILPIYEVGEHDGRQYFSMKLVEQSPRPAERGLSVGALVQVVRAVHYAHQRGILHRDLKPSNILIDADGTPYVTDFGLAKMVGGDARLTQSGALVGTPGYMAPEQARAERQLTTAVDVYSLGAVLYEILTGRPPFRGAGVLDTVFQVLDREPDDPRKLNPRVDRDLSVIALKCLAKEPAKRYESAAALADDLDRWQRGEPILGRPVGPRERLVKWVRRNPVPAAFSAVILVLLVTGFTVVTRLYLRSEHFRQDAEGERDRARTRLARQYAEKAGTAADQGNPFLGLPWLVEALKATDGTPAAEPHRLHLAALLAQAPGLVHYSPMAACVALHPDGRRVAIGEKNGVELLPLGGDEPLVPPMKLSGPPSNLAFSPDGRRLLVAAGVGIAALGPTQPTSVRIFDVDTGAALTAEAKVGREKEGATSIRFSADGSVVVALWQANVNHDVVATEAFLYDAATLKPMGKPLTWRHPEGLDYVQIDYRNLRAITSSRNTAADTLDFIPEGRVWDLRTGMPLCDPVSIRPGNVPPSSLSPTGDRMLFSTGDRDIVLYDPTTGKPVGSKLSHPAAVIEVAFRPDGKALATIAKDAKIRVWDLATGKPTGPEIDVNNTDGWQTLGYSPDSLTLFQTGTAGLIAWDVRSGARLLGLDSKESGREAVFSPDGLYVTVADYDGVQLWRRSGGRALPFLPHGGPVTPMFSPDGRYLLTSGNGVRVWDLAAGQPEAHRFANPVAAPARSMSVSPAADQVSTIDEDGWVRVLDSRTGATVHPAFRPPGRWTSADLSPNGKVVLTVGWAAGQSSVPTAAELAGSMCGGTGRYLWALPRDVGVWDVATGRPVVPPLRHRTVDRVLIHPDGRSLLVTGRVLDYTHRKDFDPADEFTELSLWDLTTGELRLPVVRQPGLVEPMAMTVDGRRILTLVPAGPAANGTRPVAAQFWDVETLTPDGALFGPPRGKVIRAALSPDGTGVLTVSADGEAEVWDATTGRSIGGPFRHTSSRVGNKLILSTAAFSPDGRRVVTTIGPEYGSDGEARVWDVATGRPVTPVLRSHGWVRDAVFSPDGRFLVTLGRGENGAARVWETDTGMPVTPPIPVPARNPGPVSDQYRALADEPRFTSDGRRLLIPSDDGLSVIDLTSETRSPAELEPLAQVLSGLEVDSAGGPQPLSEVAAVTARDRWRQLMPGPRTGPDPTYAERRAQSAVSQEAWDPAVRWLWEYLRDQPNADWARAHRANALEKLGRLNEARADWDEFIRRADGPTARARRGDVLAELGRFPDAATDFTAAWDATGRPTDGMKLALARWAAGDRAGYRQACEQLRDRREEFTQSTDGYRAAALACGLAPDAAVLVRPFIPLLEQLRSVQTGDFALLRPLALAYVRTGVLEKTNSISSGLSIGNEHYAPHWQPLTLALPKVGGPFGLIGIHRANLLKTVDDWYDRNEESLDWTERVIVPELRKQADR